MNNYINYYNKNISNNNLLKPEEGFIRGNMFDNLYDPYLKNEPYEIRFNSEKDKLLYKIYTLCFAQIDLDLYLDLYPNDMEVLNIYNKYKTEKNLAIKEYEDKYGSLTLDSESLERYPWNWIDKPWPWNR